MAKEFTTPPSGPEKSTKLVDLSALQPSERYDHMMATPDMGVKAEDLVAGNVTLPQSNTATQGPDVVQSTPTVLETPQAEPPKMADPSPAGVFGGKIICQRCGWDTTRDIDQPTEEDKKAFLRAVLGNVPYERTYDLFGGSMKVTLQARTIEQADMLMDQMDKDVASGKLVSNNFMRYLYNLGRYQVAICLIALTRQGAETKRFASVVSGAVEYPTRSVTDTRTLLERAFDAKFQGWPAPMVEVVLQTQRIFEQHIDCLTSKVNEPDFWTSAGTV